MNEAVPHILVVDDDAHLRELLLRHLVENGFEATTVSNGAEMWQQLSRIAPDLVILDIMLPGADGFALARDMKANHQAPILMLSARSEETDRIVGLEIGADDYLPKPFDPRELIARIRSILRRHHTLQEMTEGSAPSVVFGPFVVDIQARTVTRDGKPVDLPEAELALLIEFAKQPYRVFNRDELIDLLRGDERTPFDRSIDIRVTRLRRKIEDEPQKPRYIHTVWGIGYQFIPDRE